MERIELLAPFRHEETCLDLGWISSKAAQQSLLDAIDAGDSIILAAEELTCMMARILPS